MLERVILDGLIRNEAYCKKALPNLKKEYFPAASAERTVFELVDDFVTKYSKSPTPEALGIELTNKTDLNQNLFNSAVDLLEGLSSENNPFDETWLVDQTERFCQDKALFNALAQAHEIWKNKGEKGLSTSAIPGLLQDALAVTFDPDIGHDYLADSDKRYQEYHLNVKRIPFDLHMLNKITKGGLLPKTLNVVMAVSGAGKSLFMGHCAAANLMNGYNVLYITLELSEEMLGARLDANLLGIDMDMLSQIPKDVYDRKIAKIREKTTGRLVVKGYSNAGAPHFRHLLNELKLKKGFVPDIIYIDYLNLCKPSRKGDMNSYERVKECAEEIRAIAVDFNLPILSATQTNRAGYGNSDVGMENTSDSLGLPMTCDLFFALIQTETLERLGQYKVLQLKSRYDDVGRNRTFSIGVNKIQMRLCDVQDEQDTSGFTTQATSVPQIGAAPNRLDFSGFK